jgi:hypothetical protein
MPGMSIVDVQWFSFLAYPLSGGFKSWSLITSTMAKLCLKVERRLEPLLGSVAGFRMMLVIEKQ